MTLLLRKETIMEIFYSIPDSRYHERYSISEYGTIRRHYNNGRVEFVKKVIDSEGRTYVRLKGLSRKVYYLDDLLVFTFKNHLGLPLDVLRSIHLDGIISNNALANLEINTEVDGLVPYNQALKQVVF